MKGIENINSGEDRRIFYQQNDSQPIEVRVSNDSVWLTQAQIATMFGVQKSAISKHLKNIFSIGELCPDAVVSKMETTANDGKKYATNYYNLDAILSIGYRVNSVNATHFRIWANQVLKAYLLRGAAVNQRFEYVEDRLRKNEQHVQLVEQKLDGILHIALPPKQGIFFRGQVFDAYQFVADLIRSANQSILLIDNYVDDSVLALLSKRNEKVSATILVSKISPGLQLDLQRHNAQYSPVEIKEVPGIHDRFLLLDDTRLYTFGASFKDLGKKLFCFSKIDCTEVVEVVRKLRNWDGNNV